MNELLDQIVELYFLGGDLREILAVAKETKCKEISRIKRQYHHELLHEMFKDW